MKIRYLVFSAFVLCLAATLHAALPEVQMDWGTGPQNITDDTDVRTDGTLVAAYGFGDSSVTDVTLNGVTFQAFALPNDGTTASVTLGNYSVSASSDSLITYNVGSQELPFGQLSPNYQSLLTQGGSAASPATLTLTLSGLVVGQQYLFQFWTSNAAVALASSDNRFSTTGTANMSINLVDNTTNADGGMGQFAVGTFTANATAEIVNFTGIDSVNDPLVNAFQLRAIAVPEPTNSVLLGLGLLTGSFFFRRRRSA